ncbi:uncharacterized protein LOC141640781 [Silene latifolia]|uniref:uncharacterized protein LOC141640781 n=1 Tax=Silene latifolia TaxID=37657 RepID=UPI003D775734
MNVVSLVDVTQKNLKKIREDGWTTHMEKVTSFCQKNEICVPVMSDMYVVPGRCRRGKKEVDNLTHFRIEVFLSLIDQIWREIDDLFSERSKDLLTYMSCFNPRDRFSSFNIRHLLQLATFYPCEFSSADLLHFEYELGNFVEDVKNDDRFWDLESKRSFHEAC